MFTQGDKLRELGLEVSSMYERKSEIESIAKSQVGFFDFVAIPLFSAFSEVRPCPLDVCMGLYVSMASGCCRCLFICERGNWLLQMPICTITRTAYSRWYDVRLAVLRLVYCGTVLYDHVSHPYPIPNGHSWYIYSHILRRSINLA